MLYIFYGIEEFIIKKKIEALWKSKQINNANIMQMNLIDQSLFDVLNETEQSNLFSLTNFVIADNLESFILKKQNQKQEQFEKLINFSKKEDNSMLILICNKEKIPKNNFQTKLGQFSKIIECPKLDISDKRKMVTKAFENREVEITPQLVDFLIKRSKMNIRGLISEVEKISLAHKRISKQNIQELINPAIEDNIFSLINSILDKNYELSIQKYEDLVSLGTSPLTILTLIGNETALMSVIIEANFWKISHYDISEIFKKPLFAISKLRNKMIKYDKDKVISINKKISQLEFEFKSGKISQGIFIHFFMLEYILERRNYGN